MVDIFYGAYVDHGDGPSADPHDYQCGWKAYRGHRGVDILLRNFQEQDAGVGVLAAAAGVVASTTDGMPDRNTSWEAGGGFGNHVVVDHAEAGIRSIYAHLRRGSIGVETGERVERGHLLGLVGSSGRSNWPHLHFEVQIQGVAVDPFSGDCSGTESLWLDQLPYQNTFMVTDAGITEDVDPFGLAALLERPQDLREFPLDAEAFRVWVQLANQPAAAIRFETRGPDGTAAHVVEGQVGHTFSMRFLGTRVPVAGVLTQAGPWEVRVYQDGALIQTEPFTLVPAAAAAWEHAPPVGAPPTRAPASEIEVVDQASVG
jgi:murein DD-endopeptidase MepM/ murein hydrolase activator NlpD